MDGLNLDLPGGGVMPMGSAIREQPGDGLPADYTLRPEWEMTARQVVEALRGDDPPVLIDCRTAKEREICRIDGAKHVAMDEVAAKMGELEELRDSLIVIHCHHGMRSLRVTAYLRSQGFMRVMSMAGGIDAWSIAVDGRVSRY